VILDADRALEWWTPAAGKLLRLQSGDEGEPIVNLVRAPAFVAFIRAGVFNEPVELEAPDDPNRILQFSANHFGDNEVALVVQDISRLRHLEQMRKEFVANISHELRTPLTVLTGYLETLGDSDAEVPASWRQALGQMTEQARRLTLLTEDLVTLSQLESTALPARTEPVPLKPLLGGIVENARALGGSMHHIELDCPDGLIALGAARELHSAFANLVYNAVKHNPQGCTVGCAPATTTASVGRGDRQRDRHRCPPSSPSDRTLLPRRGQSRQQFRRHRSRSRHRQTFAAAQRRTSGNPQYSRQGQHLSLRI